MIQFSIGDKVLLKDTAGRIATVCDISTPGLVRVKIDNGTLVFFEPQYLQKLPTDPGCETRLSSILMGVPTVKKIIHNGVTTVTQFVDGTKMVTRPSEDDGAKYDPYVGWCVGVTAKLFGGKERAKKFYKAHAVMQKAVEPVKAKVERNCNTCEIFPKFNVIDCFKCFYPDRKNWRAKSPSKPEPTVKSEPFMDEADLKRVLAEIVAVAKEQAEKEVSLKRKQYDDSVSKRHCYVCEGYHSLSNFAPCKGCWEAGNAGHHPNFTPKPFEE